MALIKSKELNNGATATYWVAQPSIDKVNEKTYVIMLGFKDKATRDAGKIPLSRERVDSIDGTYLTGEQVYTAVKTSNLVNEIETNWFADATNDI